MSNSFPAKESSLTVRPRWEHVVAGIFVFFAVVAIGYSVLHLQASRTQARQTLELVDFGSALHERINHELSSVLYLTSGINSYLTVRHKDLQRDEVQRILANLYSTASHIRNFGIAEGYRVAYVHPIKGNEKALGLSYPDLPSQWPDVKRVIDTGKPFLVGPIDLVQGGQGLIYRVPVIVEGHYWGLISTVVDADSLKNSVLRDTAAKNIAVAVRGRNGLGSRGEVFWGDVAVFQQPNAQFVDVNVPGGKWVIAVASTSASFDTLNTWVLRALWLMLGVVLGFATTVILGQRDQLTRLALYDGLTGLPNRRLLEDRIDHAISLRRRNDSSAALLFIDLDGFKQINDQHGHKAGDVVLQSVAERLQRTVRETDTVGRWGGDEMIMLLENADRPRLAEIIEQVRCAIETPTELSGKQLKVGASIGLAVAPDDGDTLSDLTRVADGRMYEDKVRRRPVA